MHGAECVMCLFQKTEFNVHFSEKKAMKNVGRIFYITILCMYQLKTISAIYNTVDSSTIGANVW